jgi:hypothetical protein
MSDLIRDLAGLTWREVIRLWALSVLCCLVGIRLASLISEDGPPLSFNPWPLFAGAIGLIVAYPIDRCLRARKRNQRRDKVS